MSNNELIGLRVVRGPSWAWEKQDGGEGFVGSVVSIVGNVRNVRVRWDSGDEYIYRIGAENAYDLRVLDNSIIGVKHVGITCQGCDDIELKGFFPGASVRRGKDWIYGKENGNYNAIGKVIATPFDKEPVAGKVWVKWSHDEATYSYRIGLEGKVDLEMVKAGFGGLYKPTTLPVLKFITKQVKDQFDTAMSSETPLVVGDRVKILVELENLREMMVNFGLKWNAVKMKKVLNAEGTIEAIYKKSQTVVVDFRFFWDCIEIPEKAVGRLVPFLPVGAVIQVRDESDPLELPDDVAIGDFGVVDKINVGGKRVHLKFFKPDGRLLIRRLNVSQVKAQPADMSVFIEEKIISEQLVTLLISEVKKGVVRSVLKKYPTIVNCRSSYNGKRCTPLSVACQTDNLEMVHLLIKHNAAVTEEDEEEDEEDEEEDEEDEEEDDEEEFYEWKENDDPDEEEYADKNLTGNYCIFPIHHAIFRNSPEILKVLLENGASPNQQLPKDRESLVKTPLHLAASRGQVECVRHLLEDKRCEADFEEVKVTNRNCVSNGKNALELACESQVQSLTMLSSFKTAGNLTIDEGDYRTLLPLCAEYNNLGAAKYLLLRPKGKQLGNKIFGLGGDTPLHVAYRKGHNELANFFEKSASSSAANKPLVHKNKEKKVDAKSKTLRPENSTHNDTNKQSASDDYFSENKKSKHGIPVMDNWQKSLVDRLLKESLNKSQSPRAKLTSITNSNHPADEVLQPIATSTRKQSGIKNKKSASSSAARNKSLPDSKSVVEKGSPIAQDVAYR